MDGNNKEKKLGVIPLAALVVSAMIGGGIFSLPQNMAQSSALLGVILAWIVTGIGMFFLANTFRILAEAKPDATTGIYAYARLGFGRFAGFQMAWSYWLCNIFGNSVDKAKECAGRAAFFVVDSRTVGAMATGIGIVL